MAAGIGSPETRDRETDRRTPNARVREDTFEFVEKKKAKFDGLEANCFMLDCETDPERIRQALAKELTFVGRVWSAWLTAHRLRVQQRPAG